MQKVEIVKIINAMVTKVSDQVAEEVPLTININKKEFVTLLCSPFDIEDLIRGFLFTSGLIRSNDDIEKIVEDKKIWAINVELKDKDFLDDIVFKRMYTSGCGKGTLFYNVVDLMSKKKNLSEFHIQSDAILDLMSSFQKMSEVFVKTGGVHSAAICDLNSIIVVPSSEIKISPV